MSLVSFSRRAFLAAVLLLALAVPALAQVQSGNIFGTVLNQDDNSSIPGITVTLTGAATQLQISDGQGKFRFVGLTPGSYNLRGRSKDIRRSSSGGCPSTSGGTPTWRSG